MPAEQFLEQVDEARPRTLGGKGVVADSVEADLVRVGVGEAMRDMAVGMDLPVGAGFRELLPERDDFLRRNHWVVPPVEGNDLRRDLFRREVRRVEEAVESDCGGDVR